MKIRLLLSCACLSWLSVAAAGIPADGRHCGLTRPPADAGAYVTPGGFLLVWPRNAGFARDYSGCRTLWVMQSADDTPLLMRLYFPGGRLEAVQGFDGRGGQSARTCVRPFDAPGCGGIEGNPLTAPDLPTWPRLCTEQPEHPACRRDPE
ncbi:hypothetical protein METUNv1_02221 [Methyloversatilis universalis FAM5]|uniref:Secreted protein n=1 Tax=Methyloversatilis universalis (strain ATCC BAA-1314 / DSM 25237 / JCM 13912 / CCUG 52030 / FAM5) TaxID=1000565 RepID=F5RD61_METUF|nr:hypothetical protein [Methyloversatilis universalis]EGK71532.1 hypothetical protein METUNv1_02221 [Methyloversatilis universalis FAM5]